MSLVETSIHAYKVSTGRGSFKYKTPGGLSQPPSPQLDFIFTEAMRMVALTLPNISLSLPPPPLFLPFF